METHLFGLTGTIGAGKSLVSKFLSKDPDILVLDSDTLAKDIVLLGMYTQDIETILGCTIERNADVFKKIASIIFSDAKKLKDYQNFIHPLVWKEVQEKSLSSKKLITIVESAILFESGGYSHVDKIIVVTTNYENQMNRLCEHRNMTEKEIHERLSKQMTQDEKIKRADFIIENNGTIEELEHSVNILITTLKKIAHEN